jgi:hypothetical protein
MRQAGCWRSVAHMHGAHALHAGVWGEGGLLLPKDCVSVKAWSTVAWPGGGAAAARSSRRRQVVRAFHSWLVQVPASQMMQVPTSACVTCWVLVVGIRGAQAVYALQICAWWHFGRCGLLTLPAMHACSWCNMLERC